MFRFFSFARSMSKEKYRKYTTCYDLLILDISIYSTQIFLTNCHRPEIEQQVEVDSSVKRMAITGHRLMCTQRIQPVGCIRALASSNFLAKGCGAAAFLSLGQRDSSNASAGIVCRMDQNAEAMYYDGFSGFCRKATVRGRQKPISPPVKYQEMRASLQTHRYRGLRTFARIPETHESRRETTSDESVAFSPPMNLRTSTGSWSSFAKFNIFFFFS